MNAKKITMEHPKKVKVVNPNPHSTEPKPSFVLDTPNPQSQPVHSPDICPSPDDPHQDVDKSHLSDSTGITTNLNETCSLDTSPTCSQKPTPEACFSSLKDSGPDLACQIFLLPFVWWMLHVFHPFRWEVKGRFYLRDHLEYILPWVY